MTYSTIRQNSTILLASTLAAASLAGAAMPAMADTAPDPTNAAPGATVTKPTQQATTPSMTVATQAGVVTMTRNADGSWTGTYPKTGLQPETTLTAILTDPAASAPQTIILKSDLTARNTSLPSGQTKHDWSGAWKGQTPDGKAITLSGSGSYLTGIDRTDLNTATANAAKALAGAWHTADSERAVQNAVRKAADPVDQAAADKAVQDINEAVDNLKTVSFTVKSGDTTVGTFTPEGVFTASKTPYEGIPGDTITISPNGTGTGINPMSVKATAKDAPKAVGAGLGVVLVTGTVSGTMADDTHPDLTATFDYRDSQGKAGTIEGVKAFQADKDGVYVGSLQVDLNGHNTPMFEGKRLDAVTVPGSTGAKTLSWSPVTTSTPDKEGNVTAVQRTASLDGVLNVPWTGFAGVKGTVDQRWRVDATATRTRDTHVDPILLRTRADGSTIRVPVSGPTVTLDADAATDHYSLTFDRGPDADVSDPVMRVETGAAARTFTWTANGTKHTLRLTFRQAPIVKDSPARLTGIWVDYTGTKAKGRLIDGWNPNRLTYTLSIGEHAPSPYIYPTSDKTVDVKATDVRQTADGAAQTWTVTAKSNGVERRYTVTVIRARSWMTADERFIPAAPVEQKGTVVAKGDDTMLQSYGYVKDGRYTPAQGRRLQIPEGGTFAYQPKIGQVATVSQTRLHGTTWRYTVGVLAPDGDTWRQTVVDVTYITAATHTAMLTGLQVNGRDVAGFDPEKTTYRVGVADPAQWVVSPRFDRRSGMSVDTAKHGTRATITVTSADGLATRVYRVDVTRSALAAGAETLAQTGVMGWPAAITAMMMMAVGAVMLRLHRRLDA